MVRINKKLEYALILLGHWVRKPGLLSAKDAEQRFGLSFDVTSKVMQALAQTGILKSVKGARGGYLLEKDPATVSMFDLHLALVGPVSVASCLQEDGICDLSEHCSILSPVLHLNERISQFYRGITVAELLRSAKAQAHAAQA
ncbi:MAG: Rrf2 family transcriptional regulator [Spirochaetes bacterium]|nr:Rrf2 family transcriptional regulator [Spirochaetota bacterium]